MQEARLVDKPKSADALTTVRQRLASNEKMLEGVSRQLFVLKKYLFELVQQSAEFKEAESKIAAQL